MVGFSAAVLVGGMSRRMGQDKALIEIDGVGLARRAVGVLHAAGASQVKTVGGMDRSIGVEHVADRYPGEGPLGGLITALNDLSSQGTSRDLVVAVVACDLPQLSPRSIRTLMTSLGEYDAALARTDRVEPLCAVWRSERVLGTLEAAFSSGERAIRRVLTELHIVEVPVDGGELVNLNTPDDVQGLRRATPSGARDTPAN